MAKGAGFTANPFAGTPPVLCSELIRHAHEQIREHLDHFHILGYRTALSLQL